MAQEAIEQQNKYLPAAKNLGSRYACKCRQVMVNLIIPQSRKCLILGIKVYRDKLAPRLQQSSSRLNCELLKIHNKQNWFQRCGCTAIDNAVGLAMAMLTGKIVHNYVEVQSFGNLWGLLATRPVVSESTYEVLSFSIEFFIALLVFTLTDHYVSEYRLRKETKASAE